MTHATLAEALAAIKREANDPTDGFEVDRLMREHRYADPTGARPVGYLLSLATVMEAIR